MSHPKRSQKTTDNTFEIVYYDGLYMMQMKQFPYRVMYCDRKLENVRRFRKRVENLLKLQEKH